LKVSCAAIAPQDHDNQKIIVQNQTTANTVKMAAPEIISSGIKNFPVYNFFSLCATLKSKSEILCQIFKDATTLTCIRQPT
ncbi:hypothetical protein EBR57_02670, partial [bacterium]|nr:hypothetical protein [bacterium]